MTTATRRAVALLARRTASSSSRSVALRTTCDLLREALHQLGERGVGAGLRERAAAVDHDRLAGDVARPVGREEQDHLGDLVGLADAAERDRLGDRLERVGHLLPHRGERRADVAGRDAVDAHGRAVLERAALRERDHARLRGRVRGFVTRRHRVPTPTRC